MHVWDLTSGARLETWRRAIHPDREYQIGDLSPDNRWCLTIGGDGAGVFRDIVRRRDVDPHLDARQPYGIAFSADSTLFAVTSGIGARYTKVWNTADRREVARLGGGHSVAFSPYGRRLAIGDGGEKAVVAWDLESRRQLVALAGEGSMFNAVAFSPDGNVIGSGNTRGDLYLWRAPPFEEIAARGRDDKRRSRHNDTIERRSPVCLVWRKTDGTQAGFNAWRTHFGQSFGSGAGANVNAAVPEPTTLALVIVGTLTLLSRRSVTVS